MVDRGWCLVIICRVVEFFCKFVGFEELGL